MTAASSTASDYLYRAPFADVRFWSMSLRTVCISGIATVSNTSPVVAVSQDTCVRCTVSWVCQPYEYMYIYNIYIIYNGFTSAAALAGVAAATSTASCCARRALSHHTAATCTIISVFRDEEPTHLLHPADRPRRPTEAGFHRLSRGLDGMAPTAHHSHESLS